MLGERIRNTRQSFGWTQVELANRLGIAKQTVSNWENNNIQPSVDMLIRIAGIFNTSTDYLLERDNRRSLDVNGLNDEIISHLSRIVDDFRKIPNAQSVS